ncbi:MAG: Uncharacterized protein AWU57_464 [Marinobacter sp. T13-3]|nr:MAG: Uncharacterized protein AWU57_464 [Marinobacter sp. T13-3]
MFITELRTFKTANVTVEIRILDLCKPSGLQDDWKEASHQGGRTVQIPNHLIGRVSGKHYLGHLTPAELASDYAKAGTDNPSRKAYQSLQEQLAYDLTASDYTLECRVRINGIHFANGTPNAVFDYSAFYSEDTLEERAAEFFREIGRDFVFETIQGARDQLAALKRVA